jgi:hypothetical protein
VQTSNLRLNGAGTPDFPAQQLSGHSHANAFDSTDAPCLHGNKGCHQHGHQTDGDQDWLKDGSV